MISMDITLPYLSAEKSRHGRTCYYVRWKGKRVRVLGRPKDAGFVDRYRDALRLLQTSIPTAQPIDERPAPDAPYAVGTLGWLIGRYIKESPEYAVITRTGKVRRERILSGLKDSHGRRGMIMATEAISAGLAKRAATPGAANEWLKSVKALYSWALKVRITTSNPADPVRKIKVVTDGHHIWSLDEVRAFVTRHPEGTPAYLAMILMLFTGLRREDASRLGRQHIRDGVVRFRPGKTESKTGAELVTTLAWPIKNAMDACPPPDGCQDMTIILNGYGRRFASGAAFGNWFKDKCREAGIAHCTAHGLRKAAASIAAEEGASDMTLDAMFAWSESGAANQSRTYTRNANKLRLASEGFELVAGALVTSGIIKAAQIGNRIVAP